jgi:threonine dehydrogenase-like Zn-dependent dehydrogenase
VRAAVISSPRAVRLTAVADPEPGPGEVLVALEGAGVCASELPVWEGREWFRYPLAAGAPGHEGWGRVAARGEGVDCVRAGERVAIISERAHAEYDLAPARNVVALPRDWPQDAPFPGEPLACAVNVMRRAGLAGGERVAVIGAGFLALALVALAAGAAGSVEVVARRREALERALAAGADHGWLAEDPALRGPFDVVIEATGAQRPLDLAARLCAVRGRLVIAGYHQDGPRLVDMRLWNWHGLDVINAHERDPAVYARGLAEAIAAVQDRRLDPAALVTHRFPLRRLGDAYELAASRPEGFLKAVWVRD